MGPESTTVLEMRIPKSWVEVLAPCFFSPIIIGFSFLGVLNLIHFTAVIPSLLWLTLIGLGVYGSSIQHDGLGNCLKIILGDVAGRKVVEFSDSSGQPPELKFGYDVLGFRLITKCIPTASIRSVEWSTGQATDMAGRDMDDWMVWLWYDHNDAERLKKELPDSRMRGQDNYQIGPQNKKAITEELGVAFKEFLRKASVELTPESELKSFARETPGS